MDANSRRKEILHRIMKQEKPLSASALAKDLKVSRQVIVGDVAILRAKGHEIVATARGYVIPSVKPKNGYIRKIACQHTPEQTKDELYLLVDLGVSVEDVIIEHDVYGELTGSLRLETRADVDLFIEKVEKSQVKLLSELTIGIHLHTVICRDQKHFEEVEQMLKESGYLLDEAIR